MALETALASALAHLFLRQVGLFLFRHRLGVDIRQVRRVVLHPSANRTVEWGHQGGKGGLVVGNALGGRSCLPKSHHGVLREVLLLLFLFRLSLL